MLRKRFLLLCERAALERRKWVLWAGFLFTLLALGMASRLGLNFQWTEMLPEDSPLVQGIEGIHTRFETGHAYIVAIGATDPEKLEAAVDDAASAMAAVDVVPIRQVMKGVSEDFALDHGLGTLRASGLRRAERLLSEPGLVPFLRHLNDALEDDYSDDSEQLGEDERSVVSTFAAIGTLGEALARAAAGQDLGRSLERSLRDLTTGDPYIRSLDGELALVLVSPLGEVGDINSVIPIDQAADSIFLALAEKHPGVSFERTGVIPISRDELESLGGLTFMLSALAASLAYLLLAINFRDWSTPLLATAPLGAGIIWALALYALTVQELNIMTAVIMMVLTGLGIDFSIHIVGRYQEERDAGHEPAEAVHITLVETGGGVITGGLTTALAFFALMVTRTKGIREFGFCAGWGVLLTLVAVLVLLPALLVWRDQMLRGRGKNLASRPLPVLGRVAAAIAQRSPFFSLLALVTTALGVWLGTTNAYQYNMLELEPRGLRSVELQPEIVERFGVSMEVGYALASDLESSRRLADAFLALESVGEVDDLSRWIPPRDVDLASGIRRIREAALRNGPQPFAADSPEARKALSGEVGRLRDNLIELGDLAFVGGLDRVTTAAGRLTGGQNLEGPLPRLAARLEAGLQDSRRVHWDALGDFGTEFGQQLAARVARMTRLARATTVEDLPPDVVSRYVAADDGELLITLMPKGDIYERAALQQFNQDSASVHEGVVGTPQLILAMNEEMLRGGTIAIPAAFVAIALLLFCDFRRIKPTAMAMVPLLVASAWLVGCMRLIGLEYNFVNVVAIPILIGIGVDDGVHLLHRLRHGGGLRTAGAGVGRAMLLTSLTTMVGFGSIGLYSHRGMASLGIALAIGVAACFLATLVALPPLLHLFHLLPPTEGEKS